MMKKEFGVIIQSQHLRLFLSYYQTLLGGSVPFRKAVLQHLVQEGPVIIA